MTGLTTGTARHTGNKTLIDMKTCTITLTYDQLELISNICHDFKDFNRGDAYQIMPVMKLEEDLVKQTDGVYEPDTTYDM